MYEYKDISMKKYLRSIKKWIGRRYDEVNERVYLDVLIGAYENAAMSVPEKSSIHQVIDAIVKGERVKITFLVGTSHRGLLLYRDGQVFQLFPFLGFYGITMQRGVWYAFHKTGRHGRIISFRLDGDLITDAGTNVWGLSRGGHQIDFINDALYVTDTYNNAILRYDDVETLRNVCWRRYSARLFPNGRLKHGRRSGNYNHFNSIYKYGDTIYLVAHNETRKTGRSSEIFLLDKDFQVKDIRRIDGSNCHNFYKDERLEIIGLSLEGAVQSNGMQVLQVGKFLRGISISDDYYVFGGSDIELDREKRGQTQGTIYVTDRGFNILLTVKLSDTQIQEIRRVDRPDYTFSNVKKRQ